MPRATENAANATATEPNRGSFASREIDSAPWKPVSHRLVIAELTALFMAVDYRVAGPQGRIVALITAAAMNLFSYWNADRIVLSV